MVAPKVCTGFEFGTTAGIVTGNAGNKLFDSQLGSPSIVTTTPRTGNYCLELNPSAGEEWVQWGTDTIGSGQTRLVLAFALRFVTSLPAADTLLTQIDTNAGPTPNIWFRTSDDKLVVHAGGGSPGSGEVAGPTVAADTWYYIELYSDCSAATHTLDWWVDGTAQTQSTTSSSASTFFSVTIGGPVPSQTYTGRYDDVVVWTDTSEITTPVGQHKVQILNVDTGTAYVLNGTAANWSTFTANGTIDSSFTVTEARDRTDEWPPTIGASADGLIQDATSTTDNVEIAMTTYTLQSGESIAGVRMLACGWAVSGTAATFGFRSYNGTTETILQAGTVDPSFDNSTTDPAWVCKMLTEADFDTQAELDGLRFRVGYSSDAAPDIGIHAIAAELAVKEAAGGTTGTAAAIQQDDTSVASGQLGYSGTSTAVQEDQTSSASGTVVNPVTGTSTAAQEDQTSTASGTVSGPVSGTAAVTQEDQTSTALGQLGYSGLVAVTQADQTSSASGQLGYSGSSATTQADQISAAAGQLGYTGTSAVTQDDQTSTASGTVSGVGEITGSAAVTQDDQTSTATGQLGYTGITAAFQADQAATAAGTVVNPVTGTIAATQDDQTPAAAGQLGYSGTVAAVQADQTVIASGTFAIAIEGLIAALQSDQVAAATGFVGEIPIPAGRPLEVPSGSYTVNATGQFGLVAVAGHKVTATARAHTVEAQ